MTNFGNVKGVRFGTWNVMTLYQDGKLEQACSILNKYNLSFMGMSEVRRNLYGQLTTAEGHDLFWSGMPHENDIHQYGVGMLIHSRWRNSVIDCKFINECMMVVRFSCRVRNLSVVQCYAPTENSDDGIKDSFYDMLNRTLDDIPAKDLILLLGDFNSKVGDDNAGLEHIMGKHGTGIMNDNGQRLTELCGINELKIGGTLFPHKKGHKVTWISPDTKTENQIDHICVSAKWSNLLCDVRSKRGADIGSDHYLLIGKIRLGVKIMKKSNNHNRVKYKINKLKDPVQRERFSNTVNEKLGGHALNYNDVQHSWNVIKTTVNDTCLQNLGRISNKNDDFISAQTWSLIDNRAILRNRLTASKIETDRRRLKSEYSQLDKQIKRAIRDDKRMYVDNMAAQAKNAAALSNMKDLFTLTKKIAGVASRKNKPVKDLNGGLLTNVDDQLKRWKEHFESVLNIERQEVCPTHKTNVNLLQIRTDTPSANEIIDAIKSMKNGKAAGSDNIAAEVLKCNPEQFAAILHSLFCKIWISQTFPSDWLQGTIVKLYKKGDATDCNNWRGITILSSVMKIFMKVILERMVIHIDEKLRREQAGFRANRSCVDQINTLRIIIEQSLEMRSPLYTLFVDYEKAFDSISRECIWAELRNIGVPDKIISLIRGSYAGFQSCVLHCGKMSLPFQSLSGVRQGCLLSPLLFLIVIDAVSRRATESKPRGIIWNPVNPNERLESLDYADDKCELAHRRSDMQEKLNDLAAESSKVGLKINISKTKDMRINVNTNEPLTLHGTEIEKVQEYQYLGSIVTEEGGTEKDVDVRTRKALGAYTTLHRVWNNNMYSTATKIKVFKSCVLSVLLYGCETWYVVDEIQNKLRVFVNRCLRRILKIFWPNRISNVELWNRSNFRDVNIEIRRRKFGWIGHTLRKPPTEICHQALSYNPQGSRRPGRPKTTWRRSTLNEINSTSDDRNYNNIGELREAASRRERWKIFIDSLCPV